MKQLTIAKIRFDGVLSPGQAGKLLEEQAGINFVDSVNWGAYPYKPQVIFRIGHWQDNILLKFYVDEKHIFARETTINGDVYKDSCVEFFISPNSDGYYYNFEFNCIGTPHLGYGNGRENRRFIDAAVVKKITCYSSLGDSPIDRKKKDQCWELTAIIPRECFVHDDLATLEGLQAKGNFYKCGDETSEMHFVTWNPVETEHPDYHQYPFFGALMFE